MAALPTFQIDMLKSSPSCPTRKSVGHTHDILCQPDEEGAIKIPEEKVKFTILYRPNELIKHTAEIRLVEVTPGGDRPIGSY